jgi:ADP-ribose pyrophosphatase YjhB (NUDIX family)
MAYIYPFRMASGTATMLLIDPRKQEIIIGVRDSKAWVYPQYDSLPGGFMEARFTEQHAEKLGDHYRIINETVELVAEEFHEGENLEQTAVREIGEELCIEVDEDQLHMFAVRSNSRTDTRAHVINVCYWLELTEEQSDSLVAGDDLEGIRRLPFSQIEDDVTMAFNHREVMIQGYRAYLKEKLFRLLVDYNTDGDPAIQEYLQNDARLAALEKAVANG